MQLLPYKYCRTHSQRKRTAPSSSLKNHLHKCQSYAACATMLLTLAVWSLSQQSTRNIFVVCPILYGGTIYLTLPYRYPWISFPARVGKVKRISLLDLRFISKLNFSTDYVQYIRVFVCVYLFPWVFTFGIRLLFFLCLSFICFAQGA